VCYSVRVVPFHDGVFPISKVFEIYNLQEHSITDVIMHTGNELNQEH